MTEPDSFELREISRAIGVEIGANGIAPVVAKWAALMKTEDFWESMQKQYGLEGVIDEADFRSFVKDLMAGTQYVFNQFGLAYEALGFAPKVINSDGKEVSVLYLTKHKEVPCSGVVINHATLCDYAHKTDKTFQTANIPGVNFPYKDIGKLIGAEESLHACYHRIPEQMKQHDDAAPSHPVSPEVLAAMPQELHAEVQKPGEMQVRPHMQKYATDAKLGPYGGKTH